MNKYIIFLCFVGLYAPCIVASFPGSAAAGAGQSAAQQATSSPLAKLHAKQSSENKLIPWPSIIASLLPLKLVPSKTLQHSKNVWSVAWNNDDTYLATGSEGASAHIWNTRTGTSLPVGTDLPTLNRNQPLGVVWKPDGRHLAILSRSNLVYIWDIKISAITRTLNYKDKIHVVAWSPDCTRLATRPETESRDTVSIWDATTGQQLHILQHQDWVYAIAWNPDGTRLATGSSDHTARIWDPQTGLLLHTLKHKAIVFEVAWNPKTHLIATTCCKDNIVRIWDIQKGTQSPSLPHQRAALSITWNPDGVYLAVGSGDKIAHIWNAQAGTQLFSLPHQGIVRSVAWSHNGTQLATGSFDRTARIWDTAHLADPKYHAEYDEFEKGTLSPEQLMLIHLFDQFRQQQKNDKEFSLKTFAHYAQTKGITTAELARVLLTLHPVIMNGILAHYDISVQRDNLQEEYSYKAVQEAMKHIKACNEIMEKTHAQENPGAVPLPEPQIIENVLKEYLVDTENYLDAYKAWRQTQQVVPLLKALNQILEEYIVEEHPIIEQANGTKHE